ncbi:MAG: hypothetical protein QM736_12455 [Vicinamibacterales bacterium]
MNDPRSLVNAPTGASRIESPIWAIGLTTITPPVQCMAYCGAKALK